MKELKLTDGLVAFVDDEDFESANSYKWRGQKHGRGFRVKRSNCITRNGDWESRTTAFLHRFILKAKKGQIIDHIDGNALNNQKSNLRFCTHSQNIMNGPSRLGSSSKYLGFSRRQYARSVKWTTQVQLEGRNLYVGRYETEKEAALVYNVVASFTFREFARLNSV